MRRRDLVRAASAAALAGPAAAQPAGAPSADPASGGTLRVGMTTSDVPATGGIPDNGSEGGRFAGYTIYDALVNWDFTRTTDFAGLAPGLATDWRIDPANPRRWLFTLREGVRFHDGSLLTAEDVVWNFDRHLNEQAPHYDRAQAASYRSYTGAVQRYEALGDTTIALYTAQPFSMLPYLISRVFIVSPRRYAEAGRDWQAFKSVASGTGPFRLDRVTPRVAIELSRHAGYWDRARVPKLQRMILSPVPDAVTRVSALRSGQLDWIEYPAPDAIAPLRRAGFQVVTQPYPHIWAWHANNSDGSPIHDRRVRLALNYALDRDSLVAMLAGTAVPARGPWPDSYALFGTPSEHFRHEPAKARALLREAGHGPGGRPLRLKVQVPTSGSGNMVPLPMAEFVQQNYREFGIEVSYEVVDWATMLKSLRQRADAPGTGPLDAINHGLPISDPTQLWLNFHGDAAPPAGSNWSLYRNPEVDALLDRAFATFDPAPRDALIAAAHAKIVDDAPWVFVVHDLNPRAMSARVRGFVQAQSWYQDFTQLWVAER